MGPWTHTQLLVGGPGHHRPGDRRTGWTPIWPVAQPTRVGAESAFFVTGEGWRELPDWPPATTERAVYLQPGGGLADTAPTAGSSASFRYDPAEPTPTIGGRLLSPDGGYRDDSRLARSPRCAQLHQRRAHRRSVRARQPGRRVGAQLRQPARRRVRPDQRSRRQGPLPKRQRRLPAADRRDRPPSASNSTRSRTDSAPASRIRVLIAGGSHPRFARNLGTGEPTSTGSQLKPSTHEVHFGTSRIVFPVGS